MPARIYHDSDANLAPLKKRKAAYRDWETSVPRA